METTASGFEAAAPHALAAWLAGLQAKLFSLPEHLDDSWHGPIVERWPFLAQVLDTAAQGRLLGVLLLQDCRGTPPAQRLSLPEVRLALQDRAAIQRSLCALALARRPGVLRCCIDREARDSLRDALGALFEPLARLGQRGRPVSAEVAVWSPLHWACMGYVDWLELLEGDDRLFRRIVRLSLPQQLLAMPKRRRQARAEFAPAQAVQALKDVEVGWPC
jgi:hypothetical protein